MGTFSIWHWVVVLVIVLVLFGGRGKLSQLMGDMAKGQALVLVLAADGEGAGGFSGNFQWPTVVAGDGPIVVAWLR